MRAQIQRVSTPKSPSGSRLVVVCALLLGLAACRTTTPAPPPPASGNISAAGAFAIPAGALELPVVTEESLLQILVYRGGAMARLGHNHVIASHHLSGTVYETGDPLATRFDISFPVGELTVDEPALREAAGPDFPPGVPQNARDGTRTNMLSPALLDGSNYPVIRLRAVDVKAAGDAFDAGVEVTFKGATHVFRVPVRVQRSEGKLVA